MRTNKSVSLVGVAIAHSVEDHHDRSKSNDVCYDPDRTIYVGIFGYSIDKTKTTIETMYP